jgi:hypothetical protein
MALTASQISQSAQAVVALANQLKAAYVAAKEFSNYNGVTDPGWNSLSGASVSNGLVVGTQAAPGDISNAIGSLNVFLAFWEGSAVATSAWGQNLEKLANPLVTQAID